MELEHTFLRAGGDTHESRVTKKSQPDATVYYHRVVGPELKDVAPQTMMRGAAASSDDGPIRATSERVISMRECVTPSPRRGARRARARRLCVLSRRLVRTARP